MKAGQGFRYKNKGGQDVYGLIINTSEYGIEYCPVRKVCNKVFQRTFRTKCYDDSDAVYEKHKDNVRLKDCPPPFSKIGSYMTVGKKQLSNSYAYADMSKPRVMSLEKFRQYGCEIIDDGAVISERDMATVLYHPWKSRNQREKVQNDLTERNADADKFTRQLPSVAEKMDMDDDSFDVER